MLAVGDDLVTEAVSCRHFAKKACQAVSSCATRVSRFSVTSPVERRTRPCAPGLLCERDAVAGVVVQQRGAEAAVELLAAPV